MKKIFFTACVLILGFVFMACPTSGGGSGDYVPPVTDNNDNNNNNNSGTRDPALIGTWEETWETMVFNSDGSFEGYLMGSKMTPPNAKWSTSNGVITLNFTGQTKPNTASYSITNSGNTLTTTNSTTGFLGNSPESGDYHIPAVYTKK